MSIYDYLEEQALAGELMAANTSYRNGSTQMSDSEYDQKWEQLQSINPNHPFLNNVETEALTSNTYRHANLMLSTQKGYNQDDVNAWLKKVEQAAAECGIVDPVIRATAKLDGVACKYLPTPLLATRGNGEVGNVITHLLSLGLRIKGDTSCESVGEIVMSTSYFEANLKEQYAHPRTYVAGVVNADTQKPDALAALANGGIELVLYKDMPAIEMELSHFRNEHEQIEQILRQCEYPIDGVIFEATSPQIKSLMSHNSHHHNWMFAKKLRGDCQTTTVTDILYATGRSGRITPVIVFDPIVLGGATTTRVTGHHVGNIIRNKIGIGSRINVEKAGEVIPHLSQTISQSDDSKVPSCCPTCQGVVQMVEDNLFCVSNDCSGRSAAKIIHHFSTINALLFGKVTTSKIVDAGFDTIEAIYQMGASDFESAGLGAGQARNLISEINRVKAEPLADNFLLASLGISKLGRGASKKLLARYRIDEVTKLQAYQIAEIDGFGDTSATIIFNKLHDNPTLHFLLQQGFNMTHTIDALTNTSNSGALAGKSVVFTGKCSLSRPEMSELAKEHGCLVQDRVTKDTDYLVCGDNVGASKTESAKKKGVIVISEAEFRALFEVTNVDNDTNNETVTNDFNVASEAQIYSAQPLALQQDTVIYQSETNETEVDEMETPIDTANAVVETASEQVLHLDPRALQTPEWGNPRSHIADADYNNLLQSILARKNRGLAPIHTPIFVRPVAGGYEIVAGFTRKRAAIEAELATIPCLSRPMSDQEAFELAVSENVDRTAMSVLDEAKSLKEIVKLHNGDLVAAAQEMGWSRAKFDRALQLLRSSDKVRSLVGVKNENGFVLSVIHAARLSTLPEHLQDRIVDSVISEKMSASVLQDKINKAVKRPLEHAPFDCSGCQDCPYNTQSIGQTSMFAEDNVIAECTNPSCYVEKTNAHNQERIVELEKEYGKVVLLSTVDNPIEINASLVGQDQYTNGCLSCDKHCAIFADKGAEHGQVLANRCLDAKCAQEKVKALRATNAPQATAQNAATTVQQVAASAQNKGTPSAKAPAPVKASADAKLPKRLIHESQTALRTVGEPLLMQHPSYALAVSLAALKDQCELGYNVETGIIALMAHSPDELKAMIMETISKLTHEKIQRSNLNMERCIIKAAKAHCPEFIQNANAAWLPSEERLSDMTKTVRQQVLEQSGFAAAYKAANSDKQYQALLNKKAELAVKDILAFNFDWSSYSPDYYKAAIDKQQYEA